MIPAAGTVFERMRLNAPLGLNEPVTCISSSFRKTSASECRRPRLRRITGVVRTYGSIRFHAASISDGVVVDILPVAYLRPTHKLGRWGLTLLPGSCSQGDQDSPINPDSGD